MELINIENLLEAYFEGQTTLEEEKQLQNYFNNEKVADNLLQYKPIFAGLEFARQEKSNREFQMPSAKPRKIKNWWYSVAAMLILAVGVGGFYYSQPHYTLEEKEALAAFEKSKEALFLLSENLNKGTEKLTYVGQFEETKDRIFE